MKLKTIFTRATAIAFFLAIMMTGVVFADDIDNGNDGEYVYMKVSSSVTVNFTLYAADDGDETAPFCNVNASNPAYVYLDLPDEVFTSPAYGVLTFTDCGVPVPMTFYSNTAGQFPIDVDDIDGGFDDSEWDDRDANFTLVVDSTPPVITPQISGVAGANGWYTSPVIVSWGVYDPESQPTTTPPCAPSAPIVDKAGEIVSCEATSAGGTKTVYVTINVDTTAPEDVKLKLSSSVATDPVNGWYQTNVTVETKGTEALSKPLVCTANQVINTDTTGTVVNGSCTNQAGLTTAAEAKTVKLDKTGPGAATLEVTSGTLGENGWYTSNVFLKSISGGLSPADCDPMTPTNSVTDETTGVVLTAGECTDIFGRKSSSLESKTIKVDKTPPTDAKIEVTGGSLGENGWYISNVELKTTCSDDSISGLVGTYPKYQTINTDTTGIAFSDTCVNNAGLSKKSNEITIKLDKTKPSIDWDSEIDDGEIIFYDKMPDEPDCEAYDATSGVSSCVISGYEEEVGYHKMTAKAVDNAGNKRVESRYYTVEGLTVKGFYSPFIIGEKVNMIKRGTKLEIRWEVFRGPKEVLTRSIVDTLTIANIKCPLNTSKFPYNADVKSYFTVGNSDILRDHGTFLFDWKLPKIVGDCYTITAKMKNGQTISTWLKIRL